MRVRLRSPNLNTNPYELIDWVLSKTTNGTDGKYELSYIIDAEVNPLEPRDNITIELLEGDTREQNESPFKEYEGVVSKVKSLSDSREKVMIETEWQHAEAYVF